MGGDFSWLFSSYHTSHERVLREYEKLEHAIRQVSGLNLRQLELLFASGWTLEPPKENVALEKLSDIGEWPCENTT